jgi:1-acyl-sn-glycerol-3-phosphate acyltransferase
MVVKKLLQPLYAVYAASTFLAGLLICFPFFMLLAAGNDIVYRRVIYRIVRVWAQCWLLITGMPVRVLGSRPNGGRHVIVANHISYLDTVILFPALPGYFRALGKKEFSKVPLLGFLYRQIAIMVDRSSSESRAKSMKLMWRVLKRESDILIFPEGTFNETGAPLKSFYDGAFRLAITSQTPILPMVFPDTVKRWHYSGWWKLWPGKNRVVYLPAIPVTGLTMADLPTLKQQVYEAMEAELVKYGYPG